MSECDGCNSDTTDDRVVETPSGARLCEACQCDELATALFWWADGIGVERLFPQQANMMEAA